MNDSEIQQPRSGGLCNRAHSLSFINDRDDLSLLTTICVHLFTLSFTLIPISHMAAVKLNEEYIPTTSSEPRSSMLITEHTSNQAHQRVGVNGLEEPLKTVI